MAVKPAKTLAATLAAAGVLSLVSLCLLLAATPPYECGEDYASPPTPLHSGGIALGCLVYAIVGLLIGIGLRLGIGGAAPGSRWANRAITAATLTLLVAGGAVFADAGRWTCWP
jgi:hypothetical protein